MILGQPCVESESGSHGRRAPSRSPDTSTTPAHDPTVPLLMVSDHHGGYYGDAAAQGSAWMKRLTDTTKALDMEDWLFADLEQ